MSKAEKMRGRLASIQRDREEFERQKKELEEAMQVGRENMGKIQKGLKQNQIINENIIVENTNNTEVTVNHTSRRYSTQKVSLSSNILSSQASVGQSSSANYSPPGVSANTVINSMIPTGPRISDWCFTGSLDSQPPVVKTRELYENIRLLGRGAFGEVFLVKNLEDNKM